MPVVGSVLSSWSMLSNIGTTDLVILSIYSCTVWTWSGGTTRLVKSLVIMLDISSIWSLICGKREINFKKFPYGQI